jgi:ABC-2 type transport system permease protein
MSRIETKSRASSRNGGESPAPGTTEIDRARDFLRKYWNICRISLIERLTYRADFFVATLLRFLPMLTTILLWQAVYAGSMADRTAESGSADANQHKLSGFTLDQMIAYLLLVHISRMFSSMPGLAGGIARDIREGTLKKYLLQPIDMIAYLVSYRAAHKMAYIATTALPYGLLFFLCRSYFAELSVKPMQAAAYLASLLLAFVVGFFFEATIGMVGFWFLEVTSLLYIVNTLNFFVSGQMFPIDLLPYPWDFILKHMPFQFMAYFPAAVLLGKIEGWWLVRGLLEELMWAVVFIGLSRWLYHLGLRRYSAYGG